MQVKCAFCPRLVDTRAIGTCRRATGWVPNRGSTGGANVLHLRQDHDEFAHERCIRRESQGISSAQAGFEV